MKRNINHIIAAVGMSLSLCAVTSCIEETTPKNLATPGKSVLPASRWSILPTVFLRSSSHGTPMAVAPIRKTGVILARCSCVTCFARTSR